MALAGRSLAASAAVSKYELGQFWGQFTYISFDLASQIAEISVS